MSSGEPSTDASPVIGLPVMSRSSALSVGAPLFIGTAGWSIPSIHKPNFPEAGSHLARYGAVFRAAEINSSFYRPHRRSTYERWADNVPGHFRFSVKVPKTVSHSDWLDFASELDAFFSEIAGLGSKLGPLLIQLPPKRAFVRDEAARFLSAFRERTDGAIVCEPRHASWFSSSVDDLLRSFRVARVAADPPRAEGADLPGDWPGMVYFRLHGSPVIYRSAYGEARLGDVARRLIESARAGNEAWCIFDNTTSYAAAGDALTLKRMISRID
jgi:uncharacterized protein YecE (DUF72 family)